MSWRCAHDLYTHVYRHMYTDVYMCICCLHMCIHIYACLSTCVHMPVHVYGHAHACTHFNLNPCVCAELYTARLPNAVRAHHAVPCDRRCGAGNCGTVTANIRPITAANTVQASTCHFSRAMELCNKPAQGAQVSLVAAADTIQASTRQDNRATLCNESTQCPWRSEAGRSCECCRSVYHHSTSRSSRCICFTGRDQRGMHHTMQHTVP